MLDGADVVCGMVDDAGVICWMVEDTAAASEGIITDDIRDGDSDGQRRGCGEASAREGASTLRESREWDKAVHTQRTRTKSLDRP